jgi:DNA-directed RNA polymerase specialized sigma24 family protein
LQSDVDEKIGEVQASVQVQPLTRCNSAGEVYQRLTSVQSQITAALTLTSSELIERAQISDDQSPDYFQEECLVYLIREFHRRNDARTVNYLTELLIRRCQRTISGRLLAFGLESVEDAVRDVVADLLDRILDLKSDRGDFLQVRFGLALKRLVIGVYRQYLARAEEAENIVPLSSIAGYESEKDDDEMQPVVPLDDVVDSSISVEQRVLYREGLSILEEPYRRAFILRYYDGWQIETKDPSVPTLSHYFGRTPRTIRSWLTYAEDILERWRGEQYEPRQ